MSSPIQGRSSMDIQATVEKHREILPHLLAAHGLSGCDTVATYHGIGKGTVLKVLQKFKLSLDKLGDCNVNFDNVLAQSTAFMLACYTSSGCKSLTEAWVAMWKTKIRWSKASAPKLASLPPTNESFLLNVLCAHLQVAVWRSALHCDPPNLNPVDCGWKDDLNGNWLPVPIHEDTPMLPEVLIRHIKCSCSSAPCCDSRRCGCRIAGLVHVLAMRTVTMS